MDLNFEQWRTLAQPYYEVYPEEPLTSAGVAIQVSTVDELLTTKLVSPAQVLVHDPAIQKGVCHRYLLFERFRQGGGKGEVGGLDFTIDPSRLHLIDMSRRYVSAKQRSTSQGVLIPHAAIGYRPGEDRAVVSVELESPAGRILAATHKALVSANTASNSEDLTAVSKAFVELVRRLMLGRGNPSTASPQKDLARNLVIRDHVAVHLDRPELDATYLSSAVGVSRATLYRHFEDEGGIMHYIRNRRLDRCFLELSGSTPKRGKIKAVAERWHFKDASHFNRLFRARFGKCPSECLASQETESREAPFDLQHLTRSWLAQLRR